MFEFSNGDPVPHPQPPQTPSQKNDWIVKLMDKTISNFNCKNFKASIFEWKLNDVIARVRSGFSLFPSVLIVNSIVW